MPFNKMEQDFFAKGDKMDALNRKKKGLPPEEKSIDEQMAAMRAKAAEEEKDKPEGMDMAA